MAVLTKKRRPKSKRRNLLFEKVMAIFTVANLGLVLFDLSYIPWRNFYLFNIGGFRVELFGFQAQVPRITDIYDPIKGIEPYRDTVAYLEKVEQLKAEVADQGLRSTQVTSTLAELRELSNQMVDTNPFALADKTGTLERIKNRMRSRIGTDSSKGAFDEFWSQPYLSQAGFLEEMSFFDEQIKRPIQTNYFRQIGETGSFVDRFFFLDIWFISLMAIEIVLRIFYIHKSKNLSWAEAASWRWYDIFLVLPFYQFLRIIPVLFRLHKAELIDLQVINQQLHASFLAAFSEEITQTVIVRVVSQMQESVKQVDVKQLLTAGSENKYIDINNTNEVAAIASIVMQTTVEDILPQLRPDIEALLKHTTETALQQVFVYKGVAQIPGLGSIQQQLTEQVVLQISQSLFHTLKNMPQVDDQTTQLAQNLTKKLNQILLQEARNNKSVDKVKSLLIDLLEEIKINYVQRLSQEEWEEILTETQAITKSNQKTF